MQQAFVADGTSQLLAWRSGPPTLMPEAKQVFGRHGQGDGIALVKSQDIARDHELSKDIYYPLMNERGFLCGGREPTGTAAAVALCVLQANGCLDVIFVKPNFKKCAIWTAGTIRARHKSPRFASAKGLRAKKKKV